MPAPHAFVYQWSKRHHSDAPGCDDVRPRLPVSDCSPAEHFLSRCAFSVWDPASLYDEHACGSLSGKYETGHIACYQFISKRHAKNHQSYRTYAVLFEPHRSYLLSVVLWAVVDIPSRVLNITVGERCY